MTPRGSTDRLVAVLDLFTESRLEWMPEEMMETLGYSRPTLYRYLRTLRDAGLLTSAEGGGFTLGPRVVEMDYLMRRSDPLLREGGQSLDALASTHPCTALLVRWYGGKLLCVASRCSQENPRTSYPRGRPMPLARGAISRVILANLDRRQMIAWIEDDMETFRALGLGRTPGEVARAFRTVRRDGTAIAFGEVTPGVVGIAAPVFDRGRAPIAALCMTVAAETLDDGRIATLRKVVRDRADDLGSRLDTERARDPLTGEFHA